MKYIILLLVVAAAYAGPTQLYFSEWNDFKMAHGKYYESEEEESLRFQIFSSNKDKIQKHNDLYEAGHETYELEVNQFADMTEEEFQDYLALSGSPPMLNETMEVYEAPEGLEIPASVDYRKKGAVNPIKNQKSCGSCWAFSTVGALESIYFLKKKKLYSLSEQNLVDCARSGGNAGCRGGLMEAGYKYIRDNGIETERDYAYTARDGKCRFVKSKSVLKVKGSTRIAAKSEASLTAKLASVGPIAVAVDATKWQFYKRGIFSTTGSYRLNHGVVAVGYGVEKGVKYYIVRNSWGPSWGESGYIRVARDKHDQVGIADMACYPNV